jgi:hypothetical protein
MSKMFKKKKKNVADGNMGIFCPESIKMTPLTIPGVVERGQCIMCATGITRRWADGGGEGRAVHANASLVPTVKAVPVFASLSASSTPPAPSARAPPQSIPQIKSNDRILSNKDKNNQGDLKQPPEKLLELFDTRAAASYNFQSSVGSEEDEDESSVSSEDDDSSFEDYPLLDMNVCSLESEAASSVVNSLRNLSSSDVDDMDDRKPPATPRLPNELPRELSESTKKSSQNGTQNWECPLGMNPEVFYELPIEMQKEVVESRSNGASQSSAEDIDPDVLLSLPEQIRREILEQTTGDQVSEATSRRTSRPATMASLSGLSQSTKSFLSECNIETDDFNSLPEDLKNDIIGEKNRTRDRAFESIQENEHSVYGRESLASLPEELCKEILDDERRQREQNCQKNNTPKSAVGAHSVDIPAGYDPETFAALPEDMQQELRDDATRQIIDAHVVHADTIGSRGTAEWCIYEGERDEFGKRHGDGVLKWANGDEYVGKFSDGYIEGRGTISFHDGMFVIWAE